MANFSTLIVQYSALLLPFHCFPSVSGAQPSAAVTFCGTAEGGREEDDSSVSPTRSLKRSFSLKMSKRIVILKTRNVQL